MSLLWPVKEINPGDLITRNYLPNVSLEDPTRALRLLAFHRDGGGDGGGEGGGEEERSSGDDVAAAAAAVVKDGKGGEGGSDPASITATVSKNGNSNSMNVSNE